MFGLLNINKPAGVTSRDEVNRIQRLVRPAKIGHSGTLDPLATGVLIMCIGPATKLIPYVQSMPKSYRGTFLLGRESETEDIEGAVLERTGDPIPSESEIQSALPDFVGEILQRPPAFSALKVDGKRAYKMARSGQSVILEPRPIQIYELNLIRYEYPQLVLDISCGSGTYVRSLGRDIAQRLGTAAIMSALERTAIGDFSLEESVSSTDLSRENLSAHLLPPRRALATLPSVELTPDELERIRNGMNILDRFGVTKEPVGEGSGRPDNSYHPEISALGPDGKLVAILVSRRGGLGPVRNFADSK